MTAEKLKEKWIAFIDLKSKVDKDSPEYIKARNDMLVIYYPLATKVAERMHKKIKEVEVDDLASWGIDGLYDAIDRFDLSLNNKFETFAIHRIRGAILDNIRKVDWVPRLVRQRYAKVQKTKHELECKLGRCPNDEEMAQAIGLPLSEYVEMASKANPISCVSMFSNPSQNSQDDHGELQIESITTNDKHPLGKVIKEEMFQKLLGKNFVPLERKIIYLHYFEDLTMKEIAAETGYSESRISQMHARILERLQKKIHLNPEYMEGLEAILQA